LIKPDMTELLSETRLRKSIEGIKLRDVL